jgi:aminopeptidase-like protein
VTNPPPGKSRISSLANFSSRSEREKKSHAAMGFALEQLGRRLMYNFRAIRTEGRSQKVTARIYVNRQRYCFAALNYITYGFDVLFC